MKTPDDPTDTAILKARLRTGAKAARARQGDPLGAARELVRYFEMSPWSSPKEGTVIAGYWPIGSEIDCRFLLRHLMEAGCVIALPAVETVETPLVFRVWDGGLPPAKDLLGMAVPERRAEKILPDMVLVPLLLVDRSGHRLGYGGGYYDRTLSALGRTGRLKALGLAFDAQLTDRLPTNVDDVALDGLITDQRWIAFGEEGGAAPGSGPYRDGD